MQAPFASERRGDPYDGIPRMRSNVGSYESSPEQANGMDEFSGYGEDEEEESGSEPDRFASEELEAHMKDAASSRPSPPRPPASAAMQSSQEGGPPLAAAAAVDSAAAPAPAIASVPTASACLDKKLSDDLINRSGGLGNAIPKLAYLRQQVAESANTKLAEESNREEHDPFYGKAEPTGEFCYLCERGRYADNQGKNPEYDHLLRLCDTEVGRKSLFLVATEANNFYMQNQFKVVGKPMTVDMWIRHIKEHRPNKQEIFHSRIVGLQRAASKYDEYLASMVGPPDNRAMKTLVAISNALVHLVVFRDKQERGY